MIHNCKTKSIDSSNGELVTVEYIHNFWDFAFKGIICWRIVVRRWNDMEFKMDFVKESVINKSADGNYHCPFCQEVLTLP